MDITVIASADGKGSVHYTSGQTGKLHIIRTDLDFRELRDFLVELQTETVIEAMKAGVSAVPDMLREKHVIHLDAKPLNRAAAAVAR